MSLKFLQLNIFLGRNMGMVLNYVKKHNFDIINFQEVGGGSNSFTRTNTFQDIIRLGYDGELLVTWRVKNYYNSFNGNATFFKPDITLLDRRDIWLKNYKEMDVEDPDNRDCEADPKAALVLTLEKDGKIFEVINAHLAWSPDANDTHEKIRQGKLFYEEVKKIQKPFIISGDFNVEQHSEVVQKLETLGRNLSREYNVTNTLNPRLHKAQHLFPKGLTVDYIFTSSQIKIHKFEVIDLDLSDHLGLYLEAEI